MPQLLFKKAFHAAILRGSKTTTLRRWRTCRVRAGDHVNVSSIGRLLIESVQSVRWESLTDADAKADGFASLVELNQVITRLYPNLESDGKSWFRVRFRMEKPADLGTQARKQLARSIRAELDKAVHASRS